MNISKQPFRPRPIPQRMCVACREVRPKQELIRLVRTATDEIEVDPTGKKAGRGAYLCRQQSCWEAGLKKGRLEHALRTKFTPENRNGLAEYFDNFPKKEKSQIA